MALAITKQRAVHWLQDIQEILEDDALEHIQQQIRFFSKHPEQINERLRALDKEWDIERALEADTSTLFMVGNTLGFICDRKMFPVPSEIGALLLTYVMQGCCPPVNLLREMGMRTAAEIEMERHALQSLRQGLH